MPNTDTARHLTIDDHLLTSWTPGTWRPNNVDHDLRFTRCCRGTYVTEDGRQKTLQHTRGWCAIYITYHMVVYSEYYPTLTQCVRAYYNNPPLF
ncbi:MAG: hypothetical protein LBN10_03010 [Propionibacteriaceae bacterium]|jgi:hypothetical protein|nr:hypothetical protein [Propionibacteriaceae bacterium]